MSGKPRFSVDNHKLNDIPAGDTYRINQTDCCIQSLANATTFLALDTKYSYLQVELVNVHFDISAVASSHGVPHITLSLFEIKSRF